MTDKAKVAQVDLGFTQIEAAAQRWIDLKNVHPYDAIEYVSNQLLLTKIGWNRLTRI